MSLIVWVLLCAATLWGQAQNTAQIQGTVQDASGAAVPGAEVRATQTETGAVRGAVSDTDGTYVLANLPIGPYRLEVKKAVRRVKKVGNFHIFEAAVSRDSAQRKLIDDLLALFGGRTQPVMAHLIESGQLTLEDVKEAERTLRKLERKDKAK